MKPFLDYCHSLSILLLLHLITVSQCLQLLFLVGYFQQLCHTQLTCEICCIVRIYTLQLGWMDLRQRFGFCYVCLRWTKRLLCQILYRILLFKVEVKEIGIISCLWYNLAFEVDWLWKLLKQIFPFIEVCYKYIWNTSLCLLSLIFLLMVHMSQQRLDITIEV